jgi:hypothetical protein
MTMGIKKIARPMNKTKNEFVKWLKDNKARAIDVYVSPDKYWDYYVSVSGLIGSIYYDANFMVVNDREIITYYYDEIMYVNMSIDEFLQMFSKFSSNT